MRTHFLLCAGLALMITGCWFRGAATPPAWILSPQAAYPSDRYLTGIGEGVTREQAEKRAYGAVARIFSAHVQARSHDQESYSLKESGDHALTRRSLQLDHMTRVTTTKLLENVHVLETWYRPTNRQYVVLAGLQRQQTENLLLDRIDDLDATIDASVRQGRTHTEKWRRIQGYTQALGLLRQREAINTDLRIIRINGEGVSSSYRYSELRREYLEFAAHQLVIDVSLDGAHHEEIERAIWEGLKDEGLLASAREPEEVSAGAQADIRITGTGRVWTVDVPDPLFRYARWCADVLITDLQSDGLIGVISKTGREGHITEREAHVRASQSMQQVIATEVARILTQSEFSAGSDSLTDHAASTACP